MRRRLTILSLAFAIAFTSSACTADPDTKARTPEPTTVQSLPGTSSPAPTPTVPAAIPSDPATTASDECPLEFAPRGDPESVAGWRQQIPVDSGPAEYSRGTAISNDEGTPVAYTVAPGDVGAFIAERFCIDLAYLHTINSVRRSGATNLHPGDTLNLDAHTILSVGDERGVVLQNPAPSPIPPQR